MMNLQLLLSLLSQYHALILPVSELVLVLALHTAVAVAVAVTVAVTIHCVVMITVAVVRWFHF